MLDDKRLTFMNESQKLIRCFKSFPSYKNTLLILGRKSKMYKKPLRLIKGDPGWC